jgi:transcriptional regulator with XRE-family HTH domain
VAEPISNKYDPVVHPVAIRYMARSGLRNEDIARELGISRRTLQTWRNDYESVNRALIEGKSHVDNLVEEGLLGRALGMEYEEVRLKQVFPVDQLGTEDEPSQESNVPLIERTITKKKLAPDVTACIFWLKNRRPEQWRDVQEHKFSGKIKDARERQKKTLRPALRDPKALRLANDLARAVQKTRDASTN